MLSKIIWWIIKIGFIVALPFIALIRGAIYIHTIYNPGAWPSILGGIILSSLCLILYLSILYSKIYQYSLARMLKKMATLSTLLCMAYAMHTIFFTQAKTFKSSELREEMSEVHPILRLSLGTLVYLDTDVLITDASRVPEDYRKMGLKTPNQSLHYKQKDGYTYALDLRTKGRSSIRNWMTTQILKSMGFRTLRHVGTADHLHVSLYCHYR